MLKKTCLTCGKEYYVKPYRNNSRYCSNLCWTKSIESRSIVREYQKKRHSTQDMSGINNPNYKGKLRVNCFNCEVEFLIYPCRLKEKNFCSYSCSNEYYSKNYNGSNSPHWKGGQTPKSIIRLITLEWKTTRINAFIHYGKQCKYCGSKNKLHVHHVIPYRYGGRDDLENLEVVCNSCHPKIERNIIQISRKAGL